MDLFKTLGSKVESAWREAGYDELAFPAIAASALREARIHEQIGAEDVLRWLLTTDDLPPQYDIDAEFGEPPISVYEGRRFFIQVLFWLTGSTDVHRHRFSGAFLVLDGASVQSRFTFHPRRRINARFLIGDVRLRDAEVLRRGDVLEIDQDLIHSVFHLDAPSATVVVRTYTDPDRQPQLTYQLPSLAFDPFYAEPLMKRKLQGLALMLRSGRRDYDARARELLAGSDPWTCYVVLDQAFRHLGEPERIASLVEAAEERHGELASEIAASLRAELRRRKLHRLRADVRDPEQRLFLALLQNLPDRSSMFAAVKRHVPGEEPRERVLRWVYSLSGVDRIGVDFDDECNRLLFEALLDGLPPDDVLARLATEYGAEEVAAQAGAIRRQCERMRQTALAPLLRGGAEGA
jgi:hypothetical protein